MHINRVIASAPPQKIHESATNPTITLTMSVVAVAGGTGGVGKTVVEALLEQTTHQVLVLTRSQRNESDPVLKRVQQVQINYDDIDSLARTLEEQNVQTIISAIGLFDEPTSRSQLNLIQAAEKSKTTKRFIPSEFSFIQTTDLLSVDPSIKHWLDAVDLLRKTSLEFTRVVPGFFMDYWGMPSVRTNLHPITFGIDMVKCQAAIPGDGNDTISMTYSYDLARFVVKLLDLNEWPEMSIFVGDDITYNQLLQLAEDVRGKKFECVYDNPEKIQSGQVTVPPMPEDVPYSDDELRDVTVLVSRLTIAGAFNLPVEQRMNSKFPEVQPVKVKDFLIKSWRNYE